MPYIDHETREEYAGVFAELAGRVHSAGELNYLVTNLCLTYLDRRDRNYETINAIIGVLECAKLEMYRRVAVPYEDRKRKENGEVYP